MSMGGTDEFRASFFEECEELLEAMHDGFRQMVDGEADDETIHVIFRAVHSIKGGAGAFNLDDLVAFAHHFETALDCVRSGKAEITEDLLDLSQRCGDYLSDLVAAARGGEMLDKGQAEALGEQLDLIIGSDGAAPQDVSEAVESFQPLTLDLGTLGGGAAVPLDQPMVDGPVGSVDPVGEAVHQDSGYSITFSADPDLFSSGNEPALLFRALEKLGVISLRADIDTVPPLASLDASICHITWVIDLVADTTEDAVRDVFEFVSDCSTLTIEPLCLDPTAPKAGPGRMKDHPARGLATAQDPPAVVDGANGTAQPTGMGETAAAEKNSRDGGLENAVPGTAPAQPAKSAPPVAASKAATASAQTIRVDFERVDKLINLVGELVIKEAMLSQAVGQLDLTAGTDVFQELDGLKQLAGEIQEGVMAIRAQPIKPLFQRMARTVREASAMTGKRVKLVMKGEAAEVDKTVLERLVDPLNHMVRNAVDHGLESPEARVAAGKPADGVLKLSAAHRSGRVVIEISDDGAGIDREKVRKLAEERGLVAPDAVLTPAEIDALLFMPGFSSKSEVSELSGRGVGLDVVRNEINALGGRMSITSELGKGTVFSISLPLTLAVLEGMVVEVAGQTMVVPITAIQETLQPTAADIHTIGSGGRVLCIRDSLVPMADLGTIFGFRSPPKDLENHVLLVIETETERRCALIVDGLQDQRQVVIKSLETNYSQIEGIAAATILGDGRIALIVDPEGIAGGISSAAAASAQVAMSNQPSDEGESLVTA